MIASVAAPTLTVGNSCPRAVWAVLRFGLLVVLLTFACSLAVLPWVELPWWKVARRCVSIAAALGLWMCIKRFERRSFRSYGFSTTREGKRQLAFGLCLGVGALMTLFVIGLLTGACRLDITPDRARLWRTVLGFIPAAALVGVLEELVFRGFILQQLLACSKALAIVASSALYALVHLKTTVFGHAIWLELGGLFLLGGVLAMSVLLTHQLSLAIGLHAALAYGARVNKLLVTFPDASITWLTGTSRLVNGLAGWAALLGIGGLIMWWVRSSQGGARHAQG